MSGLRPRGERTAAIVLAAGLATRFGGGKHLALAGDRPLVRHVVDRALEAGVDEVVVVVGYDADETSAALPDDERVRQVANERPEVGMASSLRVGVEALGREVGRAVVLLADQPGIAPSLVAEVLGAVVAHPAARVRYRGHAGHPVAFRSDVFGDLAALTGDAGARELLRELDTHEIAVDADAPPDVDTPADLWALDL